MHKQFNRGHIYSHLKEEALHRTIWRHRFGGGFGPVIRENIEWMNEYITSKKWLITAIQQFCVLFTPNARSCNAAIMGHLSSKITYKIFTNILVKLKHSRLWNNHSAKNSPAFVQTGQKRSYNYSSYALWIVLRI